MVHLGQWFFEHIAGVIAKDCTIHRIHPFPNAWLVATIESSAWKPPLGPFSFSPRNLLNLLPGALLFFDLNFHVCLCASVAPSLTYYAAALHQHWQIVWVKDRVRRGTQNSWLKACLCLYASLPGWKPALEPHSLCTSMDRYFWLCHCSNLTSPKWARFAGALIATFVQLRGDSGLESHCSIISLGLSGRKEILYSHLFCLGHYWVKQISYWKPS